MIIRSIEPREYDQTAFIYFAGWSDNNRFLHPRDGFEAFRTYFANVVVKESTVLVALEDGIIARFIGFAGNTIEHLYVHPLHYRRGIGSRLLDHVKTTVGGPLKVSCFIRNVNAVAFYRHHGFVIVGTKLVEWYDNEPAYEWEPMSVVG